MARRRARRGDLPKNLQQLLRNMERQWEKARLAEEAAWMMARYARMEGVPVEMVAAALETTRQTVCRRLKEEGSGFG